MNLHELRQDYQNKPFTEDMAGEDPFALFKRWFEEVKQIQQPEPNAFSLATLDPMGCPDNRIVLLKEIEENAFVFYTNYSSHKGEALAQKPKAGMNFWWETVHRQVRIKGQVEKVDSAQSEAYFAKRPKNSQIGAHASNQSSVLENRRVMELRFERLLKQYDKQPQVPKPEHWGGYRIVPSYFEFWQGQASRMHDRIVFQQDEGEWVRYRLWP